MLLNTTGSVTLVTVVEESAECYSSEEIEVDSEDFSDAEELTSLTQSNMQISVLGVRSLLSVSETPMV
jgi:hypothetical protein